MIKLIQTSDKHNKFWSAEIDGDNTVHCKWGRLGTEGQAKSFPHYSEYQAQAFVDKKTYEKRKKGYREVEDKIYNLYTFRGQLVGAGVKINNIFWVKPGPLSLNGTTSTTNGKWYSKIDDLNEIANPSYDPTIFVDCQFTGQRGKYYLIITNDSVCYTEVCYYPIVLHDLRKVDNQSPKILQNLAEKADGMIQSLL
jgi:predicted DNA-binding WGR domain protein